MVLPARHPWFSGPGHQPYEAPTTEYYLAHESSEAYERVLDIGPRDTNGELGPESRSFETDDPADPVEFSPETRRAFGELRNDKSGGSPAGLEEVSGWRTTGVTVCSQRLPLDVRDEYGAYPDVGGMRLDDGNHIHRNFASVVEHDGERYVVVRSVESASTVFGNGSLLALLTLTVLFAGYGLVTALFVRSNGGSRPGASLGAVGFGAVLVGWPYLVMYADRSVDPTWPALLGTLVMGVALVTSRRLSE